MPALPRLIVRGGAAPAGGAGATERGSPAPPSVGRVGRFPVSRRGAAVVTGLRSLEESWRRGDVPQRTGESGSGTRAVWENRRRLWLLKIRLR